MLSLLVLLPLCFAACTPATDQGMAGRAVGVGDEQASGKDGDDSGSTAKSDWPEASAEAILDVIVPMKLDTIDMNRLGEIASKEGLTSELEDLNDFLKGVSGLDLGSGRLLEEPAFVKVADDLVNGRSVQTSDLLDLLRAISEGA
jgi:hypothetical protein